MTQATAVIADGHPMIHQSLAQILTDPGFACRGSGKERIGACAGRRDLLQKRRDGGFRSGGAAQTLTLREQQVLSLISQGLTNKQASDRLGVSAKTIDSYRTNLMRKLNVHSMAELLAYALREGLLDRHRAN